VKGRKTSRNLKCLTLAIAIAVLAAPTVQAGTATSVRGSAASLRTEGSATGGNAKPQVLARTQLPPKRTTTSYFWAEAGVAAAVLAAFVVLGLWGDVLIGGLFFGIGALGGGVALTARKACARAREAVGRDPASDKPASEAPVSSAQAYAGLPRTTRP
jgi:hypothetical protein